MRLSVRMVILVFLPTAAIFLTALGFINVRYRKMALEDAKDIADSYAREYANKVQAKLNIDLGIARNLATVLSDYDLKDPEGTDHQNSKVLGQVLSANPDYIAVFLQWELNAIKTDYTRPYGRRRESFYRLPNGQIDSKKEFLDVEGDDTTGIYYHVKITKKDYVIDPYFYSYSESHALPKQTPTSDDAVLETTVIVPILKNNKFIGMTGMDLPLSHFQAMIDTIRPFKYSYAFLASNNGKWVAHPDTSFINQRISDDNPEDNQKYNFEERIKNGDVFSFTSEYSKIGDSVYVTFAPIFIGNSETPWSFGIVVPVQAIMQQANKHLRFSTIVGIFGIIILLLLVIFISNRIAKPISKTTEKLHSLSLGEINASKIEEVKSGDEIGEMTRSVNTLIEALNRIAKFATEIGRENLDADYQLLGDYDILGHTLVQMRDNIKQTNNELKKLSIVASKTDTAVVIMTSDGNIEWANDALKNIYGYSLSEVKGKNIMYFSHNPNIPSFIEECIKKKSSVIYQANATTKNGEKIWVQTTITPILDNGEISRLVAIDSDINELKEAEGKINKQKEKLEIQRDKLEHLNAMKDKFFTIIAHDMKNPFASLLSITQSLAEAYNDISKEEAQFYLKRVFKSAELLHELLDNLLQWANAQTGRVDYNPVAFNLSKVAMETIQLLNIYAERKKINLITNISEDVEVYGDRNMISTVIRNLANNSIKFTPEVGSISLEAKKLQKSVVVEVHDTGIGISEEDKNKLFRIDVKTKSIGSEDKPKGTGIGLILCKEFVERNGGQIWVESEPGKGSCFKFTLKTT